jgi:hypothetical protein
MACPFFMPTNKLADDGWPHASRLPLGGGWSGYCCAPGHEGAEPSGNELRNFCNLGYAETCSRLPQQRTLDALRFSVTRDTGARLTVMFVGELRHRPTGHGILEYDLGEQRWVSPHPDLRTQKMAECYLQSYLLRRSQPIGEHSLSS